MAESKSAEVEVEWVFEREEDFVWEDFLVGWAR
jgi:hypothetical protein